MRSSVRTMAVVIAVMIIAFLGCTGKKEEGSARVSFTTQYAPIEFSFPTRWYANPADHPFDLQCFSPSQNMNTGVFVYKKIDIAANSTPTDKFLEQINDLKSKRRNFEQFEAVQKYEYNDKIITSATYVGDKDSSRNLYKFSLVEFKTDNTKFAVVLQVAIPGEWEKSKPILEEIVRSARPLPDHN